MGGERPPQTPPGIYAPDATDHILYQHLSDSLGLALMKNLNAAIILAGDVNQFKHSRICSTFKLKKIVCYPTGGNNIPDKIFTNASMFYNKAEIYAPIGNSDHFSAALKPCQLPHHASAKTVLKRRYPTSTRQPFDDDLNKVNWTPI